MITIPRNRIICADARDITKHIPEKSVHCVVTSPPYWGLRSYGEEPSVWGGVSECEHEWELTEPRRNRSENDATSKKQASNTGSYYNAKSGQICSKCGAWRGCLGLEPTPEMFIAHLKEIFDGVYRVLRDDGVMFLNMGDSYASGKGSCHNPGGGANSLGKERKEAEVHPLDRGNVSTLRESGLKPKDMSMIPQRVAFALQGFSVIPGRGLDAAAGMLATARESGQWEIVAAVEGMLKAWAMATAFLSPWWIRKDIVWSKSNPMPESTKDRPTTAHEYIFMLTKSKKYYYDWFAVRDTAHPETQRNKSVNATEAIGNTSIGDRRKNYEKDRHVVYFRNRRSVWEIATQPSIWDYCAKCDSYFEGRERSKIRKEYLCPKCGKPYKHNTRKVRGSANVPGEALFDVSGLAEFDDREWIPQCECDIGDAQPAYRRYCPVCGAHDAWEGHFAAFPDALPETCIKAATSEAGCCPICGAPWKRVLESTGTIDHDGKSNTTYKKGMAANRLALLRQAARERGEEYSNDVETVGFASGCECSGAPAPVPCVVFDPFMGAGTTAIVAWKLGRDFIGIDRNEIYIKIAMARVERLMRAGKQEEMEIA